MSNFSLDFKKFADKAVKNTDQIIRKTALDLTTAMIMDAPVLSGRFRSNFFVSMESPNEATTQSIETESGVVARAARDLSAPIGNTIYIQNNLDYAMRLEYGWSNKAPAGYARVNILKFKNILESNANETRN
jgi:hypothetical protein